MMMEKSDPISTLLYKRVISAARIRRMCMPNRSRLVFNLLLAFLVFISISSGYVAQAKNLLPPETATIQLTSAEKAWLKAHPDIELGYTDAFEPELITNPDGSYSGILVDFLDELNRRLGTRIGLRIDSVPGIIQKAKTKEVDGILEIHPKYADKLGLLKTNGYLNAYPAVFARKNLSFNGPDDFAGRKVAIIDEVYFSEKMIRQYGKQSTIFKVKDALDVSASMKVYILRRFEITNLSA